MRQNPLRFKGRESFLRWGRLVADAYLLAPSFEADEVWRWGVLAEHVQRLFRRIRRGRNGVEVVFVHGQPYETAEALKKAVRATGVLEISKDYNTHPIFDAQTNLEFRAVHDYVVHIGKDVDFTLKGEIAAYNHHARMAPPAAVPALFTEIVGQASVSALDGYFAEQKICLLPFDYWQVGVEVARSNVSPVEQRVERAAQVMRSTGMEYD